MNLYADLLFTGGRVYTADPAEPRAVAAAVAVRDGRILAVGRATELAELCGPKTQVVPLDSRLLLPGFTDSHIHFVEVALRSPHGMEVDLTAAASPREAADMVRAYVAAAAPAGDWIQGGGWDASLWTAEGALPHRDLLDAVVPVDRPVALYRKDLHSVWLNSAALRRAGITADTPNVPGGVIDRDASGEPTGILRENAMGLLWDCIPEPGLAETATAVRVAIPALWATGIVAIHNASDTADGLALRTYQALHRSRELGVRVLQQIPASNLRHALALGLRSGLGDAWLRIGGIKIFADGSLGSRTASMLQPFMGEPDNWGVPTIDPEEMLEQALAASAGGFTLTVHAIGDRANRDVLNVLAEVRRAESQRLGVQVDTLAGDAPAAGTAAGELRHRIEHVQCIDPSDLPRLAQLGVTASVQPIHATSDMLMVDRHWGPERARGAYAFRSFLHSGAALVFGSDAPVEPYSPLIGIHAAVTRRRADGTPGADGWQGAERISVAQAVDAYTRWPAYAAGEESYRGSITPGKVADLVLLSQDIFSSDPMEILSTQVEMTVLDGQVVWRRA
jgi:predicted amidohydrolase YtcJ